MKKIFFSQFLEIKQGEKHRSDKNALIANGWKFVQKSERVKINLESVQKSCRKNTHL